MANEHQQLIEFSKKNNWLLNEAAWKFENSQPDFSALLTELIRYQDKISSLDSADPRVLLLRDALLIAEYEFLPLIGGTLNEKELEPIQKMHGVFKALNSYSQSKKSEDLSTVINNTNTMASGIDGPFLFRESTQLLRRFLAGLVMVVGLALMVACTVFLPTAGIVAGALVGLAIIGGGLKLWEKPTHKLEPVARESLNSFTAGVKAMKKGSFWAEKRDNTDQLSGSDSELLLKKSVKSL